MLTKRWWRARTALLSLMLTAGCTVSLPWAGERPNESNMAFALERNVPYFSTVEINGVPGRYLFASAAARSVFDPALVERLSARRYRLQLNEREALSIAPVVLPLEGVADALIGADVWGTNTVTINYHLGMITYQRAGIHSPDTMTMFRFNAEPAIQVSVNGQDLVAIVDTASPEALVLPRRGGEDRGTARVSIAGTDFGTVDVAFADTSQARVGNRLLSRFLVSIDYGRGLVGLWRDPRIPVAVGG